MPTNGKEVISPHFGPPTSAAAILPGVLEMADVNEESPERNGVRKVLSGGANKLREIVGKENRQKVAKALDWFFDKALQTEKLANKEVPKR